MFKYVIITPFNQSSAKGTTESYQFLMEYQRVRKNMNNLMDKLQSDDTNGRDESDDIKSEGDEIKVADKELSIME